MLEQNKIDFDLLISKYKKDNFKKMKVIDHEFLYSSFHPTESDVVVCLEKNVYPKDVKIFNFEVNPIKEQGNEEGKQQSRPRRIEFDLNEDLVNVNGSY